MARLTESFAYRDGELCAENVPVARVAAAVGTPFYLYSAGAMRAQYRAFAAAFAPDVPLICYAVKANSNQAVLRVFAGLGAGADVVSEGELRRALAAGIPAERIVFSGVGKTSAELAAALDAGIHQINVESVSELRQLSGLASARDRKTRVAIRVNPDVAARTHSDIATGRKEDKFGIAHDEVIAAYRLAAELPGIEPVGLAVHIGSQIVDLGPSRAAFERVAGLVLALRQQGCSVRGVDLGGGLTVPYGDEVPSTPAQYAAMVREVFGPLDVALAFEPGRFMVAAAGALVSTVVYVKDGGRRIVVVDAAMNDLVRPAMYKAEHRILPVREPASGATLSPADVVGPVCETTDTFTRDRELPPLDEGELVAFMTAGAYGAVMSSAYNTRPLVPEVLVDGDRFAVIRARPSLEELLALDTVPDWLAS
ncbi:MAG TPA: diaminopimelate decarboxylase [Stellaceae bacterium]|jgi:diaminopimelate decarboxylase|nr:diaminopimelate decarboxylase [Stellaceae bacterium]